MSSRMSQKDLEEEFKKRASELKNLILLTEKLFKKYEKCLKIKASACFQCKICEQECSNIKDLQENKKEKHITSEEFKWYDCDRIFKSQKKLDDHEKTNEKFEWDECDKVFQYEGLLERHVDAVHSDSDCIIYCHYYNNGKECPFGDVCIFENEELEKCKYGQACERIKCMYSHDENDNEDNEDDEDGEDSDSSIIDLGKVRPVLEKVRQSVEKCDILMDQCSVKCKFCEFLAKDKNGHIKARDPTKAN